MKKSSFILIFLSFVISGINLKEAGEEKMCLNQIKEVLDEITTKKKSEPQFKSTSKYYFANRNVDINLSDLDLTINFRGIQTREEGDLKVIYTANFYDKETIGIDYIQHLLTDPPLYSYSISFSGYEAKKDINWKVKVKDNDNRVQIVQIQAMATLNDKTEILVYNSFTFRYEKGEKKYEFKNDLKEDEEKGKKSKKVEFWVIFGGMLGIVCLTYIVMTIYFAAKGLTGRPSVQVNNMKSAVVTNESIGGNSRSENP